MLLVGPGQRIDELLVIGSAERCHNQRLGFATGEQRGAVGAGKDACFCLDRADRRQVAAIDTFARLDDRTANYLGLNILENA